MKNPPNVEIVHAGGHLQCTTYLVGAPAGAVLIDPGSGSFDEAVADAVRRSGYPVSHVLLTHCHVDHARGAYLFGKRGMRIVAAPRTAEILREGGHQVWYEYPEYVIPTEVDVTPADGELLDVCGFGIRVLHTPGHTDGCASYLVETAEGLTAFTGDLMSTRGHPGWSGSEGFSVAETIASLEKLLSWAPARAYTGHGTVAGDVAEWIEAALAVGRAGDWELDGRFHPNDRPPASFQRRRS